MTVCAAPRRGYNAGCTATVCVALIDIIKSARFSFITRLKPVPEKLTTRIPTPCIGVCSTGIGDTVCRGCKRYAEEVIHWNSYTDDEKRAVNRRLDQLLTQLVSAKLEVIDADLLERRLQLLQVRYSAHRSPAVWVFELLRAGARQIDDPREFGFVLQPAYRRVDLAALREQIDQEFYLLSEAHYQRYLSAV